MKIESISRPRLWASRPRDRDSELQDQKPRLWASRAAEQDSVLQDRETETLSFKTRILCFMLQDRETRPKIVSWCLLTILTILIQ